MLIPLRLMLYGGPSTLPAIVALVSRNAIPKDLRVPLLLQIPFILLWADFYIHHVPYLFNLLPFLAVLSARILMRFSRTIRSWILLASLMCALALTYIMAYPYRTFASSRSGCVLLSLAGRRIRVIVREEGHSPKSLKLVLTLLRYDPHTSMTVWYGGGNGDTLFLYGDTLVISQKARPIKDCRNRSLSPIDAWILKIKTQLPPGP